MNQPIRRFQVGVAAVALFGLAATAVHAQRHYYYFKLKQPLTLDVDRVAMQPCELQKLTASDAVAGDEFGNSVSISGGRAVVGAWGDDDAGSDSGSAYVFRHDDNGTPSDPSDDFWVEEDKLTASDAAMGDYFGYSVSISGDRAVVGAYGDDAGSSSGSAYVFRRDDNETPLDPTDDFWFQEDKLTASGAAAGDEFGLSVSISGDRAVVGAWGDDDAGSNSGSAFVFRRDDNGTPSDPSDDFWVEEDKLTASDATGGDHFGESVSISSDRAVIGAHLDDDACPLDPTCDSGSAYVFARDDNSTPSDPSDDFWVQEAKLTASDAAASDFFGWSVSTSGSRAVVGAYGDDDAGSRSGAAYVFRRGVEEDKLTASDAGADDEFGFSVSMSGDRVVVGALYDDDAGADSGSAYLFGRSDSSWPEEVKLTGSEVSDGDRFGRSVAVSGNWAIAGVPSDDGAGQDSGSAYVITMGGEDCNQNGINDVCDVREGTSLDVDGNRKPDECYCSPSSPPPAEMIVDEEKNLVVSKKNRFLSFAVGDLRERQLIRVKFVELAPPYDQFNGNSMWVGEPLQVTESPAHTAPGQPGYTDFWAAKLQCNKPFPRDWTELTGDCFNGVCYHSENAGEACTDDSECVRAIIHLYGEFVIPGSKYEIRVLDSLCPQAEIDNDAFAPPLELATSLWGDVCGAFPNDVWTAADGGCTVPHDVIAVLSKVAVHRLAPSKTRADVIGPESPKNMQPDLEVDIIQDVIRVLTACAARPYPAPPPDQWPCP